MWVCNVGALGWHMLIPSVTLYWHRAYVSLEYQSVFQCTQCEKTFTWADEAQGVHKICGVIVNKMFTFMYTTFLENYKFLLLYKVNEARITSSLHASESPNRSVEPVASPPSWEIIVCKSVFYGGACLWQKVGGYWKMSFKEWSLLRTFQLDTDGPA